MASGANLAAMVAVAVAGAAAVAAGAAVVAVVAAGAALLAVEAAAAAVVAVVVEKSETGLDLDPKRVARWLGAFYGSKSKPV